MKSYIKPNIKTVVVNAQSHFCVNSVNGVNGLDGVQRGNGGFTGGDADSRGTGWFDDEE